MEIEVSFSAAFIAGILSFFSPCILPLIPVYLSMVTGLTVEQLRDERDGKRSLSLLISICLFIIGFSFVFSLLGASAFFLGQTLLQYRDVLTRIAGVVIIVFGITMIFGFTFQPFWSKYSSKKIKRTENLFFPVLIGMGFAIGWTPCVTPILSSILIVASLSESVWGGMGLLIVYSLGIGIPFLVSGVAVGKFLTIFSNFKKHLPIVSIISGVFLIAFGLLMIFGRLTYLTNIFMS
ncbi:MAG: sulfite exporter TauE/SafE family protein [Actinomycetia bacterium]|nr:sulfite exporter TauE/SafE family protein [Actinomycetes bacterium]